MATKFMAGKRIIGNKSDRDGLTDFNDSLESNGDGTNIGVTLVPITNHASFDGSNDYVSIVDSSSNLIQGRSTWSISGWFKRNGSTGKYFISQWGKNSSPDNRVFHIGIDSNGKLLFRQRTDGGQGASFTSNNAIPDNTWTHFAIVWQPNGSNWQAQMYINGTADNSKTDFANDMRGGSIAEPVYLGKNGSDATAPSGGGDYFNGGLYQILFYSSALTSANVTTLYNSGTPVTSPSTTGLVAKYNLSSDTNDSQGSLNGTNNGATFPTDAKLGTGAYSLDGNDYVEVNGLKTIFNGATKLSVAGWIYPRDNVDETLLGQWNGSGNSDKVMALNINGSNKLELSLRDGGTNNITTSSASINENEWQHVAMTYDGATTTVKLYINGTLDVEDTSNPSSLHTGTGSPALFGIYGDKSSNGFDGILDDWGVWSRVLTATEIEKLANNNNDGSTGWTFKTGGTASYEVSGGKIKLSPDNSGSTTGNAKASVATYDIYSALGNSNLANTWVLRATVDTVFNISGNDAGMVWNVGCCDSPASTFTTNQDENGTVQSIQGLRGGTGNSGGYQYHLITSWQPSQSDSNSTGSLSTNTNETKYIEVIRTSVSSASVKIYSNSDYSDTPTTISISSFTQNPANLRYIFARAHQKKSTVANYGRVYDIKLWNNTTTASGDPTVTVSLDEGNGQLVSSLTNKSELKAYYSMDTEGTTNVDVASQGISNDHLQVNKTNTSEDTILAYQVTTGSPFVGKTITGFKVRLRNPWGTYTGTDFNITGKIFQSGSTNTRAVSPTVVKMTDLTTSAWDTTANTTSPSDGSVVTYLLSSPYTIVSGDMLGVEPQGGTFDSSSVVVRADSNNSGDNYSNIKNYRNGGWSDQTWDMWMILVGEGKTCPNNFSSTSDLDAYTNIPTNTIFEQTDDTLSYWWYNGTSWVLSGDFNPNAISDLKYWLNEKCLSSYSDGDTITSVTSQDDSSTATTVANTPTVTTVNSLKAFKFLKASSEKITANTNFSDSEWTIFAVAKYDSGSGNGRVISTNSSSYNWLVGWHGNYVDRAYLGGWINQPTTTSQDLIEYSATSKSGDTKFYRENTLLASGTTTTAVNGIVIGGDYHSDEFADCTVCELIYYGKILSDSERELVSTYLINKWGVVV